MSELLLLKQKFVRLLPRLIDFAYEQGWALTLSDLGNQQGLIHMNNSLHELGLAADLNLFLNGVYQKTACPEWTAIGEFWEGLDPDCRWGGRFASGDANHFSLGYGGRE